MEVGDLMMIGKRISGRYKIIAIIGGGGMANVYLAKDMILEREVAVKVLRPEFANEDEFIRRFQREAQSTTSLVHPHIVSIFDVGEDENLHYIVMEYVDGLTLKQYILQHSPISIEKSIEIMKQLTSAIAHAHHNHIVHRDIKPQNVLLDHDGNAKITDFGIAMALSSTSITQTNSVLGTVHYLSPEQARGGMATKKSDIYSLGILMFELLTGRLPFSGESPVSIAIKHLQTDTPSPKRWNEAIPQSVENIILKATSKDPFKRYSSAEEMEENLETALDPSRISEPKFYVPYDDDATRAIPALLFNSTLDKINETNGMTKIVYTSEQVNNHTTSGEKHIEKPVKKKKKWPWILAIFLFALTIGVVAVFAAPSIFGPKQVAVPDVSGLTLDDAISKVFSTGFKMGDTIETSNEKIAEGKVIKSNPKKGSVVKEGSTIDLYVSMGKETTKLDDYRGRQYEDVKEMLKNEHYKNVSNEVEYSDEPEGTILEQNPSPNEEIIPSETVLSFVVSKGPESIELKDLSGYNGKGLDDYEETTGLFIDTSASDYSDRVAEGLVISQDPKPGTALQKGDQVNVVLSKGKKEIPTKTVVKEITIPYEPEELGQLQQIQIYLDDSTHTMTEPVESFDIDKETIKRLVFEIKEGQKAGYKVVRDQKVIMDEVITYPSNDTSH
jgi:serine/threonine protein kinase